MLDATSREVTKNNSSEDEEALDKENELQDDPVVQKSSKTGNNKKDLYKSRRRKTPIRSLTHPNNYR